MKSNHLIYKLLSLNIISQEHFLESQERLQLHLPIFTLLHLVTSKDTP